MLAFFRRFAGRRFDIAAIGDRWIARPIEHDGTPGSLRVRQLPDSLPRKRFPQVALGWIARADHADLESLTRSVQAALEQEGQCLLVLVHETPQGLAWYAYAAGNAALDTAFASLGVEAIGWGINDDPDWGEYTHAKGLVGL
jgi:hypothetical protein